MANVTLKINEDHFQKQDMGYCRSVLAKNIEPATKWHPTVSPYYEPTPEGFRASQFWRDPLTGIILLKPNVLQNDFWTTSAYEADKIKLADLTTATGDFREGYFTKAGATPTNPHVGTTHGSSAGAFVPLVGMPALSVLGSAGGPVAAVLEGASPSDFAWVAITNASLEQNEGFMISALWRDLGAARQFPEFGFIFGNEFKILLGSSGRGTFWQNLTNTPEGWKKLKDFEWGSAAGSSKGMWLNIMVLPLLGKFVGLYINQAMMGGHQGVESGVDSSPWRNHLIQVRKDIEYNAATGLNRITNASPVVFVAHTSTQFDCQMARIRYPAGVQTFVMAPDNIFLPQTHVAPLVNVWRIDNRGSISGEILDRDGTAWNKATDTWLTPKINMTAGNGIPSAGNPTGTPRIYSPEIYRVESIIDPYLAKPGRTPTDMSGYWQDLTLTMSTGSDGASLHVETIPNEALGQFAQTPGFPVFLEILDPFTNKTYRVFEGFVTENIGHWSTARPSLEWKARDNWMILEKSSFIPSGMVFDGRTHLDIWKELFRCGNKRLAEIVVDKAVADITFPFSEKPPDYAWKVEATDALADIAAHITEDFSDVRAAYHYATPGMSAADGVPDMPSVPGTPATVYTAPTCYKTVVAHAFLDPEYKLADPEASPPVAGTPLVAKFWCDRPTGVPFTKDSLRYAAAIPDLKAQDFEWQPYPPEMNLGIGAASSSGGRDAVKFEAYEKNEASWLDPNSPDFIGYILPYYVQPQVVNAQTAGAAQAEIRQAMKYAGHRLLLATFHGEWRPHMRPYQFVEVYGRNWISNDPNHIIKYGVFRIEEISWNTTHGQLSNLWYADYTLMRVHDGAVYEPTVADAHDGKGMATVA